LVEKKGYLSLVLHAHLPYVRHSDRDDYLEERWVYEAMLETYVPLLLVFDKMLADGVDFKVTMSISPTLLSMLADELIQQRFKAHLANCIELALKEGKRTQDSPDEHKVARMYMERLREIAMYCSKNNYNLIPAFRRLHESGRVELITCAATHGFLPFMETEEAIRAQIRIGIDTHEKILGLKPKGMWLPECGYTPGVDRILAEAGIRFFFVDTHGIEHATPMPTRGVYAPVITEFGVAAFARDQESSRQVWSSEVGYPGDFDYREYYRDIGYDLDFEYIAPHVHSSGIRVNTGFKYHRITGKTQHKEIYNPDWAREKAAVHAGNFMFNRELQIEHLASHMDRKPIVVAPYDAELFGHWWYEGPMFIDFLCRKIAYDSKVISMITPSEYLDEYKWNDRARLPMCTWGRNGYGEVWLNGKNDWIYRHLHEAERTMVSLVERFPEPTPLEKRALAQAARELLLAQSSDWAFIMDTQSMVEYAVRRTHDHLVRFQDLSRQLIQGAIDADKLWDMEKAFPIFTDLSLSYYSPKQAHKVNISQSYVAAGVETTHEPTLRVLMLSWEFPPNTVGGLSKAVYDLSRHLARQNVEVHVLTCHAHGAVEKEVMEGVHVHRLQTFQPHQQSDFFDWVFQLNVAMIDEVERLLAQGYRFDMVHAHDWLVAFAAIECKKQYNLPLITTIHAMEHGRNQGIYTPEQQKIHSLEWELTYESWKVIVCSQYMKDELIRHFSLPADKISILPNGIEFVQAEEVPVLSREDFRRQFALPEEKIVLYVGRMVYEKGVHLLLEGAPHILRQHPEAKFLLAGKGPMQDELKRRAWEMGLGEKVVFLGFIDDFTRNQLYRLADLAIFPSLYEPFGIVALEAISFGSPILVADTGGLGEIVRHGETGVKMYPGDVTSLINQVNWVLHHPEESKQFARVAAAETVVRYDWSSIAKQTRNEYFSILPQKEAVHM